MKRVELGLAGKQYIEGVLTAGADAGDELALGLLGSLSAKKEIYTILPVSVPEEAKLNLNEWTFFAPSSVTGAQSWQYQSELNLFSACASLIAHRKNSFNGSGIISTFAFISDNDLKSFPPTTVRRHGELTHLTLSDSWPDDEIERILHAVSQIWYDLVCVVPGEVAFSCPELLREYGLISSFAAVGAFDGQGFVFWE